MANQDHLAVLYQGIDSWNSWRLENHQIVPDFSRANLEEVNLRGGNFIGANFHEAFLLQSNLERATLCNADLKRAYLSGANLSYADLKGATLTDANLFDANLTGADLAGANLSGANLYTANLTNANLTRTSLRFARLASTRLKGATIVNCPIYGISAWGVDLRGATQSNLLVSTFGEPTITIDDLEVAQFIYILLNNQRVRDVIDTIARKVVLILGRFTPERKIVLDSIRQALHQYGYLPVLFDFDKPASRNLTETISTLAHMSRFIIADITDAKSIPQELQRIVPSLPSVPIQPLLQTSTNAYGMFIDFMDYPWVLEPYRYDNNESLLASLKEKVIDPALVRAQEIEEKRELLKAALEKQLLK